MRFVCTIICLLIITTPASAEEFAVSYERGQVVRTVPEGSEPVVGLALSGGGARGIAHIGVLAALEEHGIRIDRIAGTSMGAIVGGLYSAGYTPATLAEITANLDWGATFSSTPKRRTIYIGEKETGQWPLFELRFDGFTPMIPSSLSSGQRITSFLSWLTLFPTYTCDRDFSRLHIPFQAVATDFLKGQKVTLASGNLGLALQASSTVPLLLSPVVIDSLVLVDGGLVDNLPISTVRDMGGDYVIAVAIEESMHASGDLGNPLNIADQATSILMMNVTRLSKSSADFVIAPDMNAFTSRAFDQVPAMIDAGRAAAEEMLPALMDSLGAIRSTMRRGRLTSMTVSPRSESGRVTRIFDAHVVPGDSVLYADIAACIDELWKSGQFIAIHADLDPSTGALAMTLTPFPRLVSVHVTTDGNDPIDRTYTVSMTPDDFAMPAPSEAPMARIDALVRTIRSEGISFAAVTSQRIAPADDTLELDVSAPHLSGITLAGDVSTRKAVIMRECELAPGDVFDMALVSRTLDNLYGTNLFERVYADVARTQDGITLTLTFEEKNWSVARFGLRFDDTFNTEGRLSLTRENILGFGGQIGFTAQVGSRTRLLILQTKNERLYNTQYSMNLKTFRNYWKRSLFDNHQALDDYEDDRYGTLISLGQQMDKLGNALVQFKSETVRTRFAPDATQSSAKMEFRSIVLRSLIDTYDQYPFPQNGYTNTIMVESASEVLGGSEQFAKMLWSWAGVTSVARRHAFLGSFIVGTADPSTPDIEAFTLGGTATRLNCYDTDTGNTHYYADFMGLSDEEFRGTRITVGKVGYRLFIPRAFYLECMYTIGNVWSSRDTITVTAMRQSYGVKASLNTLSGPLSFGWGITAHGDDRLFMSAGWEF